MKYLLDTCIVSELIAKQPSQTVLTWLNAQPERDLFLSVITIGEISKGIRKLPDSRRKSTLEDWLQHDLPVRFSDRISILDLDAMLLWGNLVAKLEFQGRSLPLMDSLIAAIALHHSLTLVTRNEKDFSGIGIPIVNPFKL
jgi:toxin FitB